MLSFLITQRIHQSAHHLSLAKMGTALSCLISSKQKEEKIGNDRKHKRHQKKKEKKRRLAHKLLFCVCTCDSVYSFIYLCLAGRLKTRRWWAISWRHIASFLHTAACFILHCDVYPTGDHDRETLSRSHRWDLNWGWRHLIGWQLRSSGPVLHCISSAGDGGAEAVMASSLPFSAC